jgi:hypothetical protein
MRALLNHLAQCGFSLGYNLRLWHENVNTAKRLVILP